MKKKRWYPNGYKEAYRVIPNCQANDFNDEPRYRIVKYEVDPLKNRMRAKGWKSDWHRLMEDTIYDYGQALKVLESKKGDL